MNDANARESESRTARDKLYAIIRDIGVGMLTTVRNDGRLHTRPMVTRFEGDGATLWFFSSERGAKTEEVRGERHVSVSYADPKRRLFAAVSGNATVVRDRGAIERLWEPTLVAWFPRGLEDPDLALLRVDVRSGEYWDAPSSTMVEILAAVQTGLKNPPDVDVGDHAKVKL